MKRQNNLIPYLFLLLVIFGNQCSQIKNCPEQCKNATNECITKAYLYTAPLTPSSTSSSSTATTTSQTNSEAEPNDTFTDSFNSQDISFTTANNNGLGASNSISYLKNATISATTDIDIFFIYLETTNISISITQKSGIGAVTCNLYSRDSTTTYLSNSSTPDGTFTSLGNLNTTYSYAARANIGVTFLAVCSGTAGTAYSIQVVPFSTSSSNTSLFTGPINIINYSSFASCAGADASCRNSCSAKL